MCLCCCQARSNKQRKPPLLDDFPLRPNAGYTPLPGYSSFPKVTYGTLCNIPYHLQPVNSATTQPSAPVEYSNYSSNSGIPNIQHNNEIRYDRPPPYRE